MWCQPSTLKTHTHILLAKCKLKACGSVQGRTWYLSPGLKQNQFKRNDSLIISCLINRIQKFQLVPKRTRENKYFTGFRTTSQYPVITSQYPTNTLQYHTIIFAVPCNYFAVLHKYFAVPCNYFALPHDYFAGSCKHFAVSRDHFAGSHNHFTVPCNCFAGSCKHSVR